MLPNLAARPFLDTRPVWLASGAAVLVGAVLLALNLSLFFSSNQATDERLRRRLELEEAGRESSAAARREVAALEQVPWRTLERRVDGLNLILREYSFSWLRLLDDVAGVLPYQVRLVRISPSVAEDGYQLQLEGSSQTRDAMLDLLENLIADPRFADPLPRSEKPPEGSASAGYDFVISVRYLPPEAVGAAPEVLEIAEVSP